MATKRVLIAAVCAASVVTSSSYAQDAKSWDGTWKGYWNNKSMATIIISGGKLVQYEYGTSPDRNLTQGEANATSFAFHGNFMHIILTRTGETSANAQYGNIRGGSGGAAFVRQ